MAAPRVARLARRPASAPRWPAPRQPADTAPQGTGPGSPLRGGCIGWWDAAEDKVRAAPGFDRDIAHFTDYPGGHPEGFPDSHKMHYRCVYEHIASGKRTPALFATAADGHEEVRLCEAILKSHAKQTWVRV